MALSEVIEICTPPLSQPCPPGVAGTKASLIVWSLCTGVGRAIKLRVSNPCTPGGVLPVAAAVYADGDIGCLCRRSWHYERAALAPGMKSASNAHSTWQRVGPRLLWWRRMAPCRHRRVPVPSPLAHSEQLVQFLQDRVLATVYRWQNSAPKSRIYIITFLKKCTTGRCLPSRRNQPSKKMPKAPSCAHAASYRS